MDLREKAQEALNNAKENGYDFIGWTPNQIASDMIRHDEDLEEADFCTLGCIIIELRSEQDA